MSVPEIPLTTLPQTLTHLLEAAALNDAARARLLDAVCESHQYVTAHAASPADVLASQRAVERFMRLLSMYQVLVSLRQESVEDLLERYC